MKFTDAQTAMIEYLKSPEFKKLEDTKDTLPSLDYLIQINKKGYITTASQEGLCKKGYNLETKNYWIIKERASISGYMKEKEAQVFMDWINMNTDKIAFGTYPANITEDEFDKSFRNHLICVTQEAGAKTKAALEKSPLYAFSKLPQMLTKNDIDIDKKRAKLNKSENVVWVNCIDPTYCRKATSIKGLYKDVLEGLEHI